MIQIEVFKGVNSIKFYNRFKSDEECLKYLSEIKRPDEAFVCARCSNVHVDEFYIGGEEEGITGRSSESAKKLVVVALEIVTDGVGRAYAQVIDDASAKSFRPFFTKYISKDAKVVTDEWKGYRPLMDEYQIEQRKSENGNSFPQTESIILVTK